MPLDFSTNTLVKPAAWPVRPELTAAPWVWDGIGEGAVYLFEGYIVDVWRNAGGTNQGADLGAVGVAGIGAEFTGSDRVELPDSVGDAIESAGTVAIIFSNDGSTSNGHFFDTRSGGNNGWDVRIASGEAQAELDPTFPSGGETSLNVAGVLPAGLNAVVCRYDGSIGYLDAITGSSSGALSGPLSRTTTPKAGNQANNADPLGAGRVMHGFIVSQRAWSQQETNAFIRDPFAFIRPDPAKVMPLFFPQAATPATYTGAAAMMGL